MEEARRHLEAERVRVAAQAAELAEELAAIVSASEGVALDDEHDPDGSTVGFERARVSALSERAHSRLTALDEALARLDAGTYGVCGSCGTKIPAERLAALPEAVSCTLCAAGRG